MRKKLDLLARLEKEQYRSGMWADTCLLLEEAAAEIRRLRAKTAPKHPRNTPQTVLKPR